MDHAFVWCSICKPAVQFWITRLLAAFNCTKTGSLAALLCAVPGHGERNLSWT